MNKVLKRLKTKLSKSKGFTLTELLFSIIILMLSTSLIIQCFNLGIANVIRETRASEAQLLCSALTSSIQNELAYAKDIKISGSGDNQTLSSYFSSSRRMGANSQIVVEGGEIKIKSGSNSYPLVASSNYKAANRAGVASSGDANFLNANLLNGGIQWDDVNKVFNVTLWVDDATHTSNADNAKDNALAYSIFSVKPIAGGVASTTTTTDGGDTDDGDGT